MFKVVMQTAEPVYTRETTEKLVKILYSTYVKAVLYQVANTVTHMDSEERTQSLRLLQYFEELFDVTQGEWDTDLVDVDINPDPRPFNCKYYRVPRINKETFCKEIQRLFKLVVLTPGQQIQYGTVVFIIPKKEGL